MSFQNKMFTKKNDEFFCIILQLKLCFENFSLLTIDIFSFIQSKR